MTCDECRELMLESADPQWSREETSAAVQVQEHLAACAACAQELRTWERVRSALRAEGEVPRRAAVERLRAELTAIAPREGRPPELMTADELARSLRMTVAWVEANLDDIPLLYLGGQLRFRRERIRLWLEQKEAAQERLRRRVAELRPSAEAEGTWALAGSLPTGTSRN